MPKLLICGDSFAADWTVKYRGQGWPNLLSTEFEIINLARAGVGQYKIYNQIISQNLNNFDAVVIAHTSPYRMYVKEHPVHNSDSLHGQCDLIYSDLKDSLSTHPEIKPVVEYFEKYFDTEYAEFVHKLICEKIESICAEFSHKVVHLLNFKDQYPFKNSLDFTAVFEQHRGSMNHFDDQGNKIVYNVILSKLQEII